MLLLENINMQLLLLLAGLMHSEEMIAAQTLVVSYAGLLIIIPYGLALGAVTLVGS
jgi:Na+-driven multidrug efflux pump